MMDLGNDDMLNSFKSLIQSANQTLLCDAQCQEKKKIDDAKQAVETAKHNIATGAEQLRFAEKNLVISTHGVKAWSDIELAEFKKQAEEKANHYETSFLQQIEKLTQANPDLLFEDSFEWLNELEKKNKNLIYKIDKAKKLVLTNNRKAGYEDEELTFLNQGYAFLLWMYSVLLLVYLFGLFFFQNKLSWTRKILLLLGFVLLPYSVHLFFVPTFFLLLHALQSIYKYFIPQNVYTNMRPLFN